MNDKRLRHCGPIVFFTRPGEANTTPVGCKIRPDNVPTPGTSFRAKNRVPTDNMTHMCWTTTTMEDQ